MLHVKKRVHYDVTNSVDDSAGGLCDWELWPVSSSHSNYVLSHFMPTGLGEDGPNRLKLQSPVLCDH